MDVGAVVVEPDLFCPGVFVGGFVVEEDNICFYAVGIKDTSWQRKDGMNICSFRKASYERPPLPRL